MIFTGNNLTKKKRFGASKRKFAYAKKTYANPFFRRKKSYFSRPNGFLSSKTKLIGLAVIVIILILLWLLFFSTLFKINKIEINGVGENMVKEVDSLARRVAEDRILGKNNLLLYDKNKLTRILNEKYYLQNLNIKKILFHTLKITIEEKRQAVVWREDDKYYYLDTEGSIITQVDPLNLNGSRLPLIENQTTIKIVDHKANIDKVTIDFVLSLFNEFNDKKHGFEIERFILDRDINTVKMAVLSGPIIYFNTKETVAIQALRLDLIIKKELADNFATKKSINLKYGNNVYIK